MKSSLPRTVLDTLILNLPHKPPALLLGSVVSVDDKAVFCTLATGSAYEVEGLLPAGLGLEAVAQAAAVWLSWRYQCADSQGMLVHARAVRFTKRYLDPRRHLRLRANPVSVGSATGLYQFAGAVLDNDGAEVFSAEFLIFVRQEGQ